VKLWYLSSFFRHERAQAGRYRQFWQVGAEALGSDDPAVDAESIALLATLLAEMGVRNLRLRLSSLGSAESRGEYRERLQAYLRTHQQSLSEEVRNRIELNPLRAFDSEHPGTRSVMQGAPRLREHLSDEDAEHFAQVQELLDVASVAYEIDSTLVRGLDYYTRTVFEFTSDALGAQSGVGGGGRYDSLVEQLGGPPTPGIGWAAGIERILLASDHAEVGAAGGEGRGLSRAAGPVEMFVVLDAPLENLRTRAFGLLCAARSAGLSAQMDLGGRSLKGQLGHANALGARYVAIVGNEQTVLKDMQDGAQEQVATDTVVHAVLRGLRNL
jgi:histidyl-tRNA synthetase